MYYKNTLKKRLLAIFLMIAMLIIPMDFNIGFAESIPQEDAIIKAIDWIKTNQNNDGSWGNSEIAFLDTSEVLDYLLKYKVLTENIQKSISWIEGLKILNNDMAARLLPYINDVDKHTSIKNNLIISQNKDGGWGICEGYESDVLDTMLVLNALVSDTNTDTLVIQKAVLYIISKQNSNGSWSYSGEGESVISLTAKVTITLSEFQTKTNLTSSDLQTAIRRAGEYLLSVQKPDKTWGIDEESIIDTVLSYHAVLSTIGVEPVDTIDTLILNVQNADGSWYESPYITALAIKAIKECKDLPNAKINSIKLLKNDNGAKTECYSYNAYETFEIQVDSAYNDADVTLLYFVKQKEGTVVSANIEGQPGWNTGSSLPGDYSVIVQVKDNSSGRILAVSEKQFVVNPSFKVGTVILSTNPENTRVDKPVEVNTEMTLVTESNIDKDLNLKFSIINGSMEVITENKTISCKAEESINIVKFSPFIPDVSEVKDYSINVQVFDSENMICEEKTIFKVMPLPPPTRIDISQSLNKEVLFPGTDLVTAQFKLKGEGIPEGPQRTPIDLVLILDSSGSMSGTPWSKTKDAAKIIADMIQPEDRCAVIRFGSSVWTQINLTSDKDLLKQAITNMPFSSGGTAMDLGIQRGLDIVSNVGSDRQKIFMLLSDGQPNSQSAVYAKVSTAIQKEIKIFTLGLGYGVNSRFMQDIANKTGGVYKFSPTPQELNTMMTEIAGEIFDTAGKNVILELTIPNNELIVDDNKILPIPTSVINNGDGSRTINWVFDRLVMGQEKVFEIGFDGSNLISDTIIQLTKNTKLTYQDRNNATVTENLPDLKIPVNKYLLDSKVATDKETYTANENINITNTTKNLTSYPSTLTGKVDITDVNGNIVKVIEDNVTNTWDAGESKNMEYSWNTCETLTGIYKARVIWSEGEKVISTAEVSFEIISNAPVSGTITVDKQQYASDEEININEIVKNNSTNNIENGITVKTTITNNEGTIIWTMDNVLSEILPNDNIAVKNIWNTAKNTPGQYIVTMEVYKGETKINQNSTKFEIVSETGGVVGISGTLNILKENIYPSDDVDFEYTINNTGNINISNVTARIRIVDTSTEEILGTLTDNMNIDISASNKQQKVWIHEPLKTGVYMVVLDAMFSNGKEISLSSGHIKVENPYETTINQVVRPRVLVWSESQENAEFASKTLSNMNVFYSIVSNAESFITELKTGKYNLYMLLDCKMPLTGEDDLLLADEIAKGKGIVVSGDSLLDNFKTLGIFGAKFRGYAGPTDYSVNFLENSLFGKVDLSGNGKVQILQLQEGEQQAIMESSKGSSPGVVFNQYQEGKAILFGFDIGSCSGETEILLRTAIELTTPINEIDQSYKEIEIKVSSKSSVDAQIKLLLPEGTDLIWSTPTIGADEMMWKFSTNANEEYKFRAFIKLPANLEQYEINAEACYSVSGQSFKFDTIKMIINNR